MKSKTSFRQLVICILVISNCLLLQAGVIPGRWEKVDSQTPSTGLMVILKSGERINCFFKSSDPESLTVVDPVAGERRIPKFDIARVEGTRIGPDSNTNGTLIGMVPGLLLGIVGGAGGGDGNVAASAIALGGIGALIGYVIDYVIDDNVQRPEVLYVGK